MSQDGELTVHLYSFSYRDGGLPPDESGHGGGFVFDCRCLPNPYWDEALRPHDGREPPVVAFLEAQPAAMGYAAHAEALVLQAARQYASEGRTRLMVCAGCTGGRHRSVWLVERLARGLRDAGIAVAVHHAALEPGAAAP